jgi:hypothetical protein
MRICRSVRPTSKNIPGDHEVRYFYNFVMLRITKL